MRTRFANTAQPADAFFVIHAISTSVPYKRKKVRNFFRHFRTEILQILVFFSRQKPVFLFPAKNRRQLWFMAPRSGMSHKSWRKLAELKGKTFFFLRSTRLTDASVSAMTFFF